MMNAVFGLLAALLLGLLLRRIKLPGGMMVGAALGAGAVSLALGDAQLPSVAKTAAQVVVGAFIGSGVSRQDLRQMRQVVKPAAFILGGLLALNVLTGLIIHRVSDMDLLTAFMSTTPGGISDIPLIAADMGADASKVLVLQFVRFLLGIGLFPSMIAAFTRDEAQQAGDPLKGIKQANPAWPQVMLTLLVALLCGLLGRWSGIPAGTMAFATIGSILFKLLYPKAGIPGWLRVVAQCLSGAYVGATIGWRQVQEVATLPLPALILALSLLTGTTLIGWALYRMKRFTLREGMMAATPAGASDMVLISADMGIHNINLVLVHIIRVIVVVTLFPVILKLLAMWLG